MLCAKDVLKKFVLWGLVFIIKSKSQMSQQEFFLFQSFYLFVVRLWKIELFDDVSDRNLNKFTKIFVKYNYHKYSKYLEIHRNSDHYIFKRKSY